MNRYLCILVVVLACIYIHDCRKLKENAQKRSGESNFGSELNNFKLQKKLHQLKQFSRTATRRLASLTDYTRFYNAYLEKLLRVRVPGTVGHRLVKQFIIDTLKQYGWHVEEQNFSSPTPLGTKNFTNVIATLYPEADRVLSLAAHYDSKLIPPKDGKYFVAATDSAVPCGILLDLARVVAEKAKNNKKAPKTVSPQLLFLDGEEAFVEWTNTDSIYGSKYMAETFSTTPHHNPELAAKKVTQLDSIDAFVLLDLLGAKQPKFYNFFGATSNLYNSMMNIEANLRKMGELTGCDDADNCRYFTGQPGQNMYIEDDHIPFLRKNVPILHLIPVPFPKVWHKLEDDESVIDPTTVENMLKIFRHFTCAYVGLE